MEFLLLILICVMVLIVLNSIKKEPVYNTSPADPDYKNMMVTITIDFIGSDTKFKEAYDIKKVLYIYNKIDLEKACDYIYDNKDLYIDEITDIEKRFKEKYNSTPVIKHTTVFIDEI